MSLNDADANCREVGFVESHESIVVFWGIFDIQRLNRSFRLGI
jgi:hypothetical protein